MLNMIRVLKHTLVVCRNHGRWAWFKAAWFKASPMISTDHLQSYATLINLLRERTIGELWKTYFPRRAIARMKL